MFGFFGNSKKCDEKTVSDTKRNKHGKNMICPRCGNVCRKEAIYCEKCGGRVQMEPKMNMDSEITLELPRFTENCGK